MSEISQPSVSIIILNYNGMKFVEPCLSSVLNSDYPNFEVIFVDNSSSDGSVEFTTKKFGHDPRLKVIVNDRNYGFAEGNNIGVMSAEGKYVIFLNVDTRIPNRQWLKKLVKVMEMDRSIGIAQPLILDWDSNRLQSGGMYLLYPFGFTFQFGKNENYEEFVRRHSKPYRIFSSAGACMMVRRSVLNEIGLFDSKFFTYFEETDLSWRTWISGRKVVTVPGVDSIVRHYGGGLTQIPRIVIEYHYAKNLVRMILKNSDYEYVFRLLPSALFILLFERFYYALKSGSLAPLIGLVNALLWNLRNMPNTFAERVKVQGKIRKLHDRTYFQHLAGHLPLLEMLSRWRKG